MKSTQPWSSSKRTLVCSHLRLCLCACLSVRLCVCVCVCVFARLSQHLRVLLAPSLLTPGVHAHMRIAVLLSWVVAGVPADKAVRAIHDRFLEA